jgi:hypothetical protein
VERATSKLCERHLPAKYRPSPHGKGFVPAWIELPDEPDTFVSEDFSGYAWLNSGAVALLYGLKPPAGG